MTKDEYKKVQIAFGFDKELKKILLPLFHTFFVAMTGHGQQTKSYLQSSIKRHRHHQHGRH
jgi:hypothetical protein